jgi:hypothetical protein
VITHLARGAQNGPVAAEDEAKVGTDLAEVEFLVEIDGDDFAMLAEEGEEPLSLLRNTRPSRIAENEDAHAKPLGRGLSSF